jgi:surface protein
MKTPILILLLFSCLLIKAQIAIEDANFQQAINTCLSTNPADGMCSDSEYGAMPEWNVSAVTAMRDAFNDRSDFNGDISNWNVSSVTYMAYMFDNSGLSTLNYDALLNGWSTQTVQQGVTMEANATAYFDGVAARQDLRDTYSGQLQIVV